MKKKTKKPSKEKKEPLSYGGNSVQRMKKAAQGGGFPKRKVQGGKVSPR